MFWPLAVSWLRAAFCAAVILSSQDPGHRALWYGLAATVALSRPYVHIHHASDMVGGAVIGYTVGRVARSYGQRSESLP